MKTLALSFTRLKATITIERVHGDEDAGRREWTTEEEVEVTGTYHPAQPAKRDGGNVVEPPEKASIALDDPGELTKAQQEQAIEALMEAHAEQVGRHESEREDFEDAKRDERRLGHG